MKKVKIKGREVEVVSTIDAVGLFCPMPIVLLQRGLASIGSQQVVEVLADDPEFNQDIREWCRRTKHKLLQLSKNRHAIITAYIEKHK